MLQALIEWGSAALDRFNGMFALAFWDKRTRKLLLARDRYGIKPLYYIWKGHTLAVRLRDQGPARARRRAR